MSGFARIAAAGTAFDRESHAIRTAWDAMSTRASGDALERVHVEVIVPYVGALQYAGREVERLATMASQAESLLAA